MDLAVLIVGFVMGFMVAYFIVGPGKEKMNKSEPRAKKTPAKKTPDRLLRPRKRWRNED